MHTSKDSRAATWGCFLSGPGMFACIIIVWGLKGCIYFTLPARRTSAWIGEVDANIPRVHRLFCGFVRFIVFYARELRLSGL